MLKVGVLVSGRGSNLQALLDAFAAPGAPASVACVLSNVPEVYALERAHKAGVPTVTIDHRPFRKDRQAFEVEVDKALTGHGVQLICLAGFMRLLTPWFVDRWRDRLINIHLSLLPAFPGLHVQQQAIDYGARFSGCTVHFVRSEMDHGPIIAQASVPVLQDDTADSLAARILESEHRIYPHVVRLIAEGRVNVHHERVFIAGMESPATSSLNPAEG